MVSEAPGGEESRESPGSHENTISCTIRQLDSLRTRSMNRAARLKIEAGEARRAAALSGWSCLLGVGVACVGAVVLAGWAFQVQLLREVLPGLATMKPDTAMGVLLLGVALAVLARPDRAPAWARVSARVVAGFVGVFFALTLLEYVIHTDFGINTIVLTMLGAARKR
jgi:hypothetical protein